MKNTEFRVGNYMEATVQESLTIENISRYWSISQVVSIAEKEEVLNFLRLKDFEDGYIRCRPLQLSESILVKLGFEKHNLNFTIKTAWYYDSQQKQKQTSLKLKLTKANKWRVISPANGSIYLKYVHELQNLFFALCGRELTFKNKCITQH